MFGKDDNQKPTDNTLDPIQNQIDGTSLDDSLVTSPAASPSFGAPLITPSDPLTSDSNAPEADTSSAPELTLDSSSETEATDSSASSESTTELSDDLVELKNQALQQLSPLVGQLDQTPEEKFRTTMMMIQASDDQTLVKSAYEAALSITDEKARAQALLDVINEINYFTLHKANPSA